MRLVIFVERFRDDAPRFITGGGGGGGGGTPPFAIGMGRGGALGI